MKIYRWIKTQEKKITKLRKIHSEYFSVVQDTRRIMKFKNLEECKIVRIRIYFTFIKKQIVLRKFRKLQDKILTTRHIVVLTKNNVPSELVVEFVSNEPKDPRIS